ncbi:TIGR00730 family Rossman fold protein [Rhodobacteraceae bacterium]|nr:TIGR00730 family Rossman fold protein [Paracoccaceae bacterium]
MPQPNLSLCVYCGARPGVNPVYLKAANDLGALIAAKGWRLVYGAGDVGIMGAVAEAAHAGGSPTLGIIPTHLLNREAPRGLFGDRIITETMHERKKVMFMNADAIAVLPGGAGSLDEFFEILTWAQLGLHDKPIFLIDINGYWQPLNALIDHVITEGFADANLKRLFQIVPDIDTLETTLSRS